MGKGKNNGSVSVRTIFHNNLEIRDIPPKGKGVFAKVDLLANEVIFEVIGDVVTADQMGNISNPKYNDYLQISKDAYIGLSGDIDDFVNHSCNPNCALRIVGNRALLHTLYVVKAGREITFDYSVTSSETTDQWAMKCNCGAFACRDIISGYQYLNDTEKKCYESLGIVPTYVKGK